MLLIFIEFGVSRSARTKKIFVREWTVPEPGSNFAKLTVTWFDDHQIDAALAHATACAKEGDEIVNLTDATWAEIDEKRIKRLSAWLG